MFCKKRIIIRIYYMTAVKNVYIVIIMVLIQTWVTTIVFVERGG